MRDSAGYHKVDHENVAGAVILIVPAVIFGPMAFAYFVDSNAWLAWAIALISIGAIAFAVRVWTYPTTRAWVKVDSEHVSLRTHRSWVEVPWGEIDHWGIDKGLPPRSHLVVLWPNDEVSSDTTQSARRYWMKRTGGWVISSLQHDKELMADLERISPVPRRDARSA